MSNQLIPTCRLICSLISLIISLNISMRHNTLCSISLRTALVVPSLMQTFSV
jgi:hypothetical protein